MVLRRVLLIPVWFVMRPMRRPFNAAKFLRCKTSMPVRPVGTSSGLRRGESAVGGVLIFFWEAMALPSAV